MGKTWKFVLLAIIGDAMFVEGDSEGASCMVRARGPTMEGQEGEVERKNRARNEKLHAALGKCRGERQKDDNSWKKEARTSRTSKREE